MRCAIPCLIAVLLVGADLRAQPVRPDLAYPRPSDVRTAERPSRHLTGALQASAFSLSGVAAISLSGRPDRTVELVTGYGQADAAFVPDALINGTVYARALHLVPVYLGLRMTIARGGGPPLSWNWYLRGGAGPAFGVVTPLGLEFFDALDASSFHWGLGVYGSTGLEVVVDNAIAFFLQVGAEGVGFARSVEGRSTLIGPSVSFGVGRLMP